MIKEERLTTHIGDSCSWLTLSSLSLALISQLSLSLLGWGGRLGSVLYPNETHRKKKGSCVLTEETKYMGDLV